MKPNFYGKSNFEVSCAVFQSELRNLKKCGFLYTFLTVFWTFLKISQFWLKNSTWNLKIWLPRTILLHLTPCLSLGVQKYWRLKLLVKLYHLQWSWGPIPLCELLPLCCKMEPLCIIRRCWPSSRKALSDFSTRRSCCGNTICAEIDQLSSDLPIRFA